MPKSAEPRGLLLDFARPDHRLRQERAHASHSPAPGSLDGTGWSTAGARVGRARLSISRRKAAGSRARPRDSFGCRSPRRDQQSGQSALAPARACIPRSRPRSTHSSCPSHAWPQLRRYHQPLSTRAPGRLQFSVPAGRSSVRGCFGSVKMLDDDVDVVRARKCRSLFVDRVVTDRLACFDGERDHA